MNLSPAKPYSASSATEKARELHPAAFAKVAWDSPRADRCQLLLEYQGTTFLAASGPTWVDALANFYEWAEEHGEKYGARMPEEKESATPATDRIYSGTAELGKRFESPVVLTVPESAGESAHAMPIANGLGPAATPEEQHRAGLCWLDAKGRCWSSGHPVKEASDAEAG